jgi:hypothetical protein
MAYSNLFAPVVLPGSGAGGALVGSARLASGVPPGSYPVLVSCDDASLNSLIVLGTVNVGAVEPPMRRAPAIEALPELRPRHKPSADRDRAAAPAATPRADLASGGGTASGDPASGLVHGFASGFAQGRPLPVIAAAFVAAAVATGSALLRRRARARSLPR